MRRPLLALLLAGMLACPSVVAQVGGCAFGAEDIAVQPASASVPPGELQRFTVTIANPNQGDATAELTTQVAGNDWSATVDNPNPDVPAGGSTDVTLSVSASQGATRTADITIVARLSCPTDPLGVLQPQQSDQQSTKVTATLASGGGGSGNGNGGPGVTPVEGRLSGATVALLVLVPLLVVGGIFVAKRRGGLVVRVPEKEKWVAPGKGVSFPVEVENKTDAEDVAYVDLSNVPAGWRAFTAMPEVHLGPHESRKLTVMVRAPPTVLEGGGAEIAVELRSKARPKTLRRFTLSARVKSGAGEESAIESPVAP
ncbi:MAG: COG1470 family protein [Methanobacteriota archaeon]